MVLNEWKTKRSRSKIVIGESNEKVGREEICGKIMGGKSMHADNDKNGTKLIEFATENQLNITVTFWPDGYQQNNLNIPRFMIKKSNGLSSHRDQTS